LEAIGGLAGEYGVFAVSFLILLNEFKNLKISIARLEALLNVGVGIMGHFEIGWVVFGGCRGACGIFASSGPDG
jgi:hypothetical protein